MQTSDIEIKRYEEIDLVKALGIILMVAGHAGSPGYGFIYLFHMGIFFMISGFFFRENASGDLRSVMTALKKNLQHLWVPFFIGNFIFVLLHNFFLKIGVYTENPMVVQYSPQSTIQYSYGVAELLKRIIGGVIFFSKEPLFGAAWFLRVLFIVAVCYRTVDYLIRRIGKNRVVVPVQTLIAIALLVASHHFFAGKSVHGLALAASYYSLYHIGHLISLKKSWLFGRPVKEYVVRVLLSGGLLHYLNKKGAIEWTLNQYPGPIFLLVAAFTGWIFLFSIAALIRRTRVTKSVLLQIGKRTLMILILHFLAFKIVTAVVVEAYHLPAYCLAAFPNLYGRKYGLWPAYVTVGIIVPVVMSIILQFLRRLGGEVQK